MTHICTPFCEEPCEPYGICTAPNTCICLNGYELVDKSQRNDPHFFFGDSVCKPICMQGCVNGYCRSPGECYCLPGYETSSSGPNVCQPYCETTCINGHCSAPNTCECDPGYLPATGNPDECVPSCEHPCENGYCSAPNTCTCDNGYHLNPDNLFACDPMCTEECQFGTCTAPDMCTCHDGYSSRNATVCEPVCSKPCVNGFCSAPEICSCNSGYKLSEDDSSHCKPVCAQDCVNGFCVEPNKCECQSGYWSPNDNPDICDPICELGCAHGRCSNPNECECNAGYRLSTSRWNICEPVCEQLCENGFCSAPNKCSCNHGYTPSQSSPNVCDPVCSKSCSDNGICSAPDVCVCKEGYKSMENVAAFDCEPICEFDCGNGTCTFPNECTCYTGYAKDGEGSCVPFCESCDNGTCVEPGVCECNDGFVSVPRGNESFCKPYCENCTNGECVAPGNCQCNVGYVKEDNGNAIEGSDCVSACKDGCHHRGVCDVEDRMCSCYYGWSGMSCEEAQFCVAKIDNRIDRLNISIRYDMNDEIGYVIANSPLCHHDCVDDVNNETFCFGRLRMDNEENDTITCLIGTDSKCHRVYAGHVLDLNYSTMAGIGGATTIIAGTSAVIYALARKGRKRRYSPDSESVTSMQGQTYTDSESVTSMQGHTMLLSEEDNNLRTENMRIVGSIVFINTILVMEVLLLGTNEDGSVCSVVVSRRESRYVPYRERYKDIYWNFEIVKTRFNYRIEHFIVTETEKRCCVGYKAQNGICVPMCSDQCENGKCTKPNTCECDEGYQPSSDPAKKAHVCEPVCKGYCQNGVCILPDMCVCNPGYQTENYLHCRPICHEDCEKRNAYCARANQCVCKPGYQSDDSNAEDSNRTLCTPICGTRCVNGKCTAPDVCTCHDGYKPSSDETMKHVCEPFCEKPCVNGSCTAPGVCNCTDGYWLNGTKEEQACVPFCRVPCEPHGRCVAPDTCSCFHGYRTIDTSVKENEIPSNVTDEHASACEPVCEQSCANGRCTEPNVCTCDEGYVKDAKGSCKPSCSSCVNGTCIAPMKCQCLQGFVQSNESVCAPYCENGCENGECVAPNDCRCLTGFQMNRSNSTCVKSCTRACKGHGICVEDEKPCECSYGWTGWDCDQPTVCILLIDVDDKSLAGLTVHNETNSTLIDAKRYTPYCYQCKETVDNTSFCFSISSDDSPSTIGCFVETESPCYLMYHSSTDAVSRMAGTLAAVTILIMAAATAATYFVIRRHQKSIAQSALFQGSVANESLISNEDGHVTSCTLNLHVQNENELE
ncbi:PREDICTED: uncharacterized protein LOC108554259 [Eufriesea mexicana]|uniref:uncharacterized protein LOC108554259 n=1 Tax=Eufriesea mexicana TaxID=516756 RepID=UPI00083C2289|nr:PREDICTED: uncharacterized protein LOC108554259 [Eufriesea mexicana]